MTKAIQILGLIGRAVDYSYSPLIHNKACKILGIPYYYTVFNIADPDLIPDALFLMNSQRKHHQYRQSIPLLIEMADLQDITPILQVLQNLSSVIKSA